MQAWRENIYSAAAEWPIDRKCGGKGMFGNLGEILIRSIISFALLLLLTRWMGKKQMAQLTYFDYITGITTGSIAATTVVERHVSVVEGVFGLILWSVFAFLLNILILSSRKARKILDGEPCLVISQGQILEENMKKMRYTLDDLMEELRKKGVFSIADVQFALLETDGKLSVQLKPEKSEPRREDLSLFPAEQSLPVELVMDGHIIWQNLHRHRFNYSRLMQELAQKGIHDLSQVVYACLGSDRKFYVDVRQDRETKAYDISD